ncbi:MAG: rhodanese-like domain-containing protein [Polyangia bacterium]
MDHSKEFQALVDDAKSRIAECTIDDLLARQQRGDKFRLIDVREDDEWRAGRARGAEHIGRGVLERDIVGKAPDKDEELILYCGGGFRSALAADNLVRMDYKRVYSLAGGWREWNKRGLPTEK